MKRKDILELKRRFKKDQCTFTRVCGCFVNSEKKIILELKETFLNLDEDDYFKYLEIAKRFYLVQLITIYWSLVSQIIARV